MKMTFAKNIVSVSAKYKCECGYKFTRKNSDWFTINPFNAKTPDECRKEIRENQSKRKRNCSKCKSECSPLVAVF